MPSRSSLESLLSAALQQAGTENRLDVAEHILRALETLERKPRHAGIKFDPGTAGPRPTARACSS
jgi:hypothetical protein